MSGNGNSNNQNKTTRSSRSNTSAAAAANSDESNQSFSDLCKLISYGRDKLYSTEAIGDRSEAELDEELNKIFATAAKEGKSSSSSTSSASASSTSASAKKSSSTSSSSSSSVSVMTASSKNGKTAAKGKPVLPPPDPPEAVAQDKVPVPFVCKNCPDDPSVAGNV